MTATQRILEGLVIGLLVLIVAGFGSWIFKGTLLRLLGGASKREVNSVKQELSDKVSESENILSRSIGAVRLHLKSDQGQTKTNIIFVNRMQERVILYWINYDGEEEEYKVLAPGENYNQETYATHPWVVRAASDGRQVAVAVGTEGVQTLEIGVRN